MLSASSPLSSMVYKHCGRCASLPRWRAGFDSPVDLVSGYGAVWSSALVWGTRGRVFESPYPDVKKRRISRWQVKRRAKKLKNFGRIDCPRCSSVVPCKGYKAGNENNPGRRLGDHHAKAGPAQEVLMVL